MVKIRKCTFVILATQVTQSLIVKKWGLGPLAPLKNMPILPAGLEPYVLA